MIAVMRFLVVHFQGEGEWRRKPGSKPPPRLQEPRRHVPSARVSNSRTSSRSSESSLPWYSYLRKHVRAQSRHIFYKCEVCGFIAKDFDQFVEHRRNHFNGYEVSVQRTAVRKRTKKHTCPECHRSFTWLCHLKSHMRTHMAEKTLKCSECDFTAKDEAELILHQRVHTWDRQFKYKEYGFGGSQSQTSLRKSLPDEDSCSKGGKEDACEISVKNQLTINLVCPPQSPNDDWNREEHAENSKLSSPPRKLREEVRKPTARSDGSRNSNTRGSFVNSLRS